MEANNDGWEPHSDSHTYRVAIDLMGYESISRFEVLGHVGMLGIVFPLFRRWTKNESFY